MIPGKPATSVHAPKLVEEFHKKQQRSNKRTMMSDEALPTRINLIAMNPSTTSHASSPPSSPVKRLIEMGRQFNIKFTRAEAEEIIQHKECQTLNVLNLGTPTVPSVPLTVPLPGPLPAPPPSPLYMPRMPTPHTESENGQLSNELCYEDPLEPAPVIPLHDQDPLPYGEWNHPRWPWVARTNYPESAV